jgi:hypothetical protein
MEHGNLDSSVDGFWKMKLVRQIKRALGFVGFAGKLASTIPKLRKMAVKQVA